MRNLLDSLKSHPYALFLTGFAVAVAYGVSRLLALLESVQGAA